MEIIDECEGDDFEKNISVYGLIVGVVRSLGLVN